MKSKTVDGVTHAVFSEPDRRLWDRMLDSLLAFQICEDENEDDLTGAADAAGTHIRRILKERPRPTKPPQPEK